MKKILTICLLSIATNPMATEKDSVVTKSLDEVSVTSLYRNSVVTGSSLSREKLVSENHGQGPDYVFSKLPGIYAYNDNGLHMGYTYFRIRGMGQERMNVTLDGMPWNEAEDFGCYFSNSPDLMGSMQSIKVEKGASISGNGTAAFAGNISLESIDLEKSQDSYIDLGAGSFKSFRQSAVYNMGRRGNWGLHIRVTNQQTDGFKENCYNNSQAFTLKTGYWIGKNHYIDLLTMTGYHRNGQGFQGLPEDLLPKHPTSFKQQLSGNRQQETDDFLTTYNRLQYKGKIDDKTFFTSTLYWQHQNGNYRIGWGDESKSCGFALNNYHLNYHLFGGNAILKYYPLENLSLSGGVNAYIYTRAHSGFDIPGDTIINSWTDKGVYKPYYSNRGNKPDVNVFLGSKWSPLERLHVNVNLQYRYTALHYKVYIPGEDADTKFDYSWGFFNYSVGLDYDLSRTSKIYTRFAVSNREPSRTDLFCGEYKSQESEMNTDNERVYDLEVGYELRTSKIKFNANLYYMSFKDELVATGKLSDMNFLPLHEQHDSRRYGVEIATEYNPIKEIGLIFNGSYSHSKIKSYKAHTFSPDVILYGEGNYTFSGKTKIGVTAQYRSKAYMDLSNEHTLPELFTLGAYLSSRISKTFEVSLNLDNITNRLNISNGSVGDGVAYYLIDSPFTIFGSCKIHF